MHVRLGNKAPVHGAGDAREAIAIDSDEVATEVYLPEGMSIAEAFTAITHPQGVWAAHSDDHPAWVSSDNKALASLLSDHYRCPTRTWKKG